MKTSTKTNRIRPLFALMALGLLAAPGCYEGEDGAFEPELESVGTVDQALIASLCSDPSNATITGTEGNDTISGTEGDDIIFALGGDDFVDGKGGNDIICGGAGNDNLKGGAGDDQIEGGAGYNFLNGNDGDDILLGGDNGNEMQGNAGNDEMVGGAGPDTMYGGTEDDLMKGEGGNDYMEGNAGNDCLDGGDGNDNVRGNDGDDCVKGGGDADYVYCGAGNDGYESDSSDDVQNCEVPDTCNCESDCNALNETFANNDAGWTLDTEWEIGAAMISSGGVGLCANSADPALDHTDTADNGVAGVAIGGNASISSLHGFYWLTSPAVDTTGMPDVQLEFWRWLVSDYTPYMDSVVQVWDGNAWQTLFNSGPYPGVQDTSWQLQQFDVSAYSNSAMQVRFGFNISSGGVWSCASWSVDDVRISPSTCQAP